MEMDRSTDSYPTLAADLKSLYEQLEEVCAKMAGPEKAPESRRKELQGPAILIRGK